MTEPFLTFTVAGMTYAISVFRVQEVIAYTEPRALPDMDPVIEGLIVSRGKSVSVVNLRKKFGLAPKAHDSDTHILVLEVHDPDQGTISPIAVIADSVHQVELLDVTQGEHPELGISIAAKYIKAVIQQNENFVIVLDTDTIFSAEEMHKLVASEQPKDSAVPEHKSKPATKRIQKTKSSAAEN